MKPASRVYLTALAGLVAGGSLCLVTSGLTWGSAVRAGPAAAPLAVTGRDLMPLAQAVGLLALAAVVAVPAARRWGRRLVGAALVVAGFATAAWSLVLAMDLPGAISSHLDSGSGGAQLTVVSVNPLHPLLTVLGGLLVASAGLLVLLRGRQWPQLGSRYEVRPRRSSPQAPTAGRAAWDALDRGEDPTEKTT